MGRQAILEEMPDGLRLRSTATYPVEIYTKERLTELKRLNDDGLKGCAFG